MEVVYVVPRPKAVHVVPRRCRGVDVTPYTTYPVDATNNRKIIITLEEIETRVHLSSQEAALSLGISVTTLKKTCRLLGMPRWPYSRKGKSYLKSYSKRPKNEAPPTYESPESPLWFPDCSTRCGTLALPLCVLTRPCGRALTRCLTRAVTCGSLHVSAARVVVHCVSLHHALTSTRPCGYEKKKYLSI